MNDNVIKFRRPEPPKQPRPGRKRALIWLGVIAAFVLVFVYFHLTGGTAAP